MALIKCPECGQNVSDTCKTCIHCGFDLSNQNKENSEAPLFDFYVLLFFKSRAALATINKVKNGYFYFDSPLGYFASTDRYLFTQLLHIKAYKEGTFYIRHSLIKKEVIIPLYKNSEKFGKSLNPKIFILDLVNAPFSQYLSNSMVYLKDFDPKTDVAQPAEVIIR